MRKLKIGMLETDARLLTELETLCLGWREAPATRKWFGHDPARWPEFRIAKEVSQHRRRQS